MFVHLHVHTEYSLLDGAARIKEVVAAARGMGMPALAITDHGSMFGVIDFYKACVKEGVKPVLGCEIYIAPRTMSDRVPHVDDHLYHLTLLAENEKGYQNLLKLVSLGYTEGFYYKPRLDKQTLARHSEGLIALSGCVAGEVAELVQNGQADKAREAAGEYNDIFGAGNFYLEVQDHGLPEQLTINRGLVELGRRLQIPLVATNDVHYVKREHAEMQDVLLCIQTGKTIDDPNRLRFNSNELYLKSAEEMALKFGELPSALKNTQAIAERCKVTLGFNQLHLPDYPIPEGKTADSYLEELCFQGLRWRYAEVTEPVRRRLDYELKVIKQMGYSAYFLIVWDFIHYARSRGIPVGPGRGSAAGSLVAYLLGITNLDPLQYGLLFERFLNPDRVSMPDVDVDLCFERRGEVINYVAQRYGADRVAQVATFGTMMARAAIRDVGRVFNMPYAEVDRVAKLVPAELHITIERALQESPELREMYEQNPQIKKLIDMASLLEGMPRHASTHAAGVVITREPLTHYLPLYKAADGPLTTQFAKDQIEELGLLKMDLLGLRTLTVIAEAIRLIAKGGGQAPDIEKIPLDDPNTFALLSTGETTGVFQLESSGMRAILRDLRPEVFEDIVALVALYRPGPLGSGMVEDFVKRKHGQRKITYLHPKLGPILRDTYGVILYQEQVMRIASDLAGFSLGEADLLRRAMGKKKPEIIAGLRSQFVDGAVKNGCAPDVAGQIFDLMEYFAGYGFNKSHSAAYAMVAYQTAYLKANFPAEYMAALLTSVRDNTDKIAAYVEECRRMGIAVLPPDINESEKDFTVVGGKIRFGLAAIKNVGVGAVEIIIQERQQKGAFRSYTDFCRRLDTRVINRRVVESLIKSGAFDSLGHRRAQLMVMIDSALELAGQAAKERANGQLSLLDLWGDYTGDAFSLELPEIDEYPAGQLLAMEKEALGLYISGHPLSEYRQALRQQTTANVAEIKEMEPNSPVVLGGMITAVKKINTRKGEIMARCQFEDLTGSCEVIVFSRAYQEYKSLLQPDQVVILRGRVNVNDEETKIVAEEISPVKKKPAGNIYLQFKNASLDLITRVQLILRSYPGSSSVYLYFPKDKKLALAPREFWVDLSTPVVSELMTVLGAENVKVKEG
ncbi:MAG: DNA polymerase III subunit alpha [Bacillota bacterium]